MASTSPLISYRAFKPSDFDAAADLLRATWFPEFSEKGGRSASRQELAGYLAASTWGLVAEKDGQLAGVVLASVAGERRLGRDRWLAEARLAQALAEGDERALAEARCELSGVQEENELAAQFKATGAPEADAVFKLLIVSPDAHGLGIGGHLFAAAERHARDCGAQGYFLMTDDTCDVSFYDHKGLVQTMRRRSQASWPGVSADDDFNVYVYARRL